MIQEIKNNLMSVLKLPLQNDMLRFNISEDQWLVVEYKDSNSYIPSKDWFKWKTLCARNCYDHQTIDKEWKLKYKYPTAESISQWIILILTDKMLWFSQDVNWIQEDFNLVRKEIK